MKRFIHEFFVQFFHNQHGGAMLIPVVITVLSTFGGFIIFAPQIMDQMSTYTQGMRDEEPTNEDLQAFGDALDSSVVASGYLQLPNVTSLSALSEDVLVNLSGQMINTGFEIGISNPSDYEPPVSPGQSSGCSLTVTPTSVSTGESAMVKLNVLGVYRDQIEDVMCYAGTGSDVFGDASMVDYAKAVVIPSDWTSDEFPVVCTVHKGTVNEKPICTAYTKIDVEGIPNTSGECASGPQTVILNGREWQRCGFNRYYTFWEATGVYNYWANRDSIDVCGDLVLEGHDDWRLPTKEELWSLIECPSGKTPMAGWEVTPEMTEEQVNKAMSCCDNSLHIFDGLSDTCPDTMLPSINEEIWQVEKFHKYYGYPYNEDAHPWTYWSKDDEDEKLWTVEFEYGLTGLWASNKMNAVRCVR